jgi:shikimate dehydrogenase
MNFLSELTGSFARPSAENPTVAMVEAAYRHHGLDWRYINCEVAPEDLGDAVRGARAMGWKGFNCSLPHKVAVIDHLDGLGESARIMGAVNCVVRRGQTLIGENTDGKGFVQSLSESIDPAGKTLLLFGAGGAARAIGVETALAGVRAITVVNRSEPRGRDLVGLLNEKTPARAEFVKWDGEARHRGQRHVHRPLPRRRRPAGARPRLAPLRDGGGRRDPQSPADSPRPRRRRPWLLGLRRPGNAGQSGRHRHQVLDGH